MIHNIATPLSRTKISLSKHRGVILAAVRNISSVSENLVFCTSSKELNYDTRSINSPLPSSNGHRTIHTNSIKLIGNSTKKLQNVKPQMLNTKPRTCNFSDAATSLKSPSSIEDSSGMNSSVSEKNIFRKMWDRYSISGQQFTIDRGEKLFRAAQARAMNPMWYREGRIPKRFISHQAILTMHVWFLHKRLISNPTYGKDESSEGGKKQLDSHTALLIQEELFEILWNDTMKRIRAEGINELMVNKHLKDIQQVTFQHCMHYDHAFTFDDPLKRRSEIALAIWIHVFQKSDESYNDQINRLALYVDWQYHNIMYELPTHFFSDGRINWGHFPEFGQLLDNDGNILEDVNNNVSSEPSKFHYDTDLPEGWLINLTDSGDAYYWNENTMESQWEKPTS